jgi:hypothetical protein
MVVFLGFIPGVGFAGVEEVLEFAEPGFGRGVRARAVVVFRVPDQAEDAVGLEDAVDLVQGQRGCEPVEGLWRGKRLEEWWW